MCVCVCVYIRDKIKNEQTSTMPIEATPSPLASPSDYPTSPFDYPTSVVPQQEPLRSIPVTASSLRLAPPYVAPAPPIPEQMRPPPGLPARCIN